MVDPAASWRDGPELIDAAWVLGIAHPSGYPLYQSLTWMAEQLPLGDIALRDHLFSAVGTLFATMLLIILTAQNWRGDPATHTIRHSWVCASIALIWFLMPSQVENAIQAEGYALFASLMFLILLMLETFMHRQERRYYLLAAFISGVGAGNQVMLGAMIFPLILALSTLNNIKQLLSTAGAGVLAGLAGLSVYAYLPVRSANFPSMDWGHPTTLARFLSQVTDRKDVGDHLSALTPNGTDWLSTLHHFIHFQIEWFSLAGLIAILIGWSILLWMRPRTSIMMLSAPLFLFCFFPDWESGTVLTGALGVEAIGITGLGMIMAWNATSVLAPLLLVLSIAALFFHSATKGIPFTFNRTHYAAVEIKRSQLLRLPYRATTLSGVAWFHLRALSDVEGIRPDVTVIGLGSIVSPQFFGALRPRHIPLLHYPARPTIGDAPTNSEAVAFLFHLMRDNRSNSRFFLDMDEDYLAPFLPYIASYPGLWWGEITAHPVANQCQILQHQLGKTLEGFITLDDRILRDLEFGRALQYGFFAWVHLMINRSPSCLNSAKGMLEWWQRWFAAIESSAMDGSHDFWHNVYGVIAARTGRDHEAFLNFREAFTNGDNDAGINLAIWYQQHHRLKQALDVAKETFLRSGSRKALILWKSLRMAEPR